MSLIGCDPGSSEVKYPDTKQEELLETIFGKEINDPYRWLEDFTSSEVKAWVEEQNEIADKFLNNPTQRKIKEDLDRLGLKFCGFENKEVISHFKQTNEKKGDAYDLGAWQRYEEINPRAFAGMYQFWCQKPV